MPDYSKPNTKLTAGAYKYDVTLTRGPLRSGNNPSHDTTGTFTPQPGDTVGDFLTRIGNWYSQAHNVPPKDVVVVRYSLREK